MGVGGILVRGVFALISADTPAVSSRSIFYSTPVVLAGPTTGVSYGTVASGVISISASSAGGFIPGFTPEVLMSKSPNPGI